MESDDAQPRHVQDLARVRAQVQPVRAIESRFKGRVDPSGRQNRNARGCRGRCARAVTWTLRGVVARRAVLAAVAFALGLTRLAPHDVDDPACLQQCEDQQQSARHGQRLPIPRKPTTADCRHRNRSCPYRTRPSIACGVSSARAAPSLLAPGYPTPYRGPVAVQHSSRIGKAKTTAGNRTRFPAWTSNDLMGPTSAVSRAHLAATRLPRTATARRERDEPGDGRRASRGGRWRIA